MNEKFGLYLILTDPVSGYEKAAEAAVNEEVRYLQLRMKNVTHETFLGTAQALRKITHGSKTRLIINDNLQVAMKADADGIHLGQNDLSLAEARTNWNVPGKYFGLSTHSMEQALQAREHKPDYIGIGPVFPTPTKSDTAPALGIKKVGHIAQNISLTHVAIGGINANNLCELLTAGVTNYCVVRAVNASSDPAGAIRQLQDIWKTSIF